jgi:hypothetical protein
LIILFLLGDWQSAACGFRRHRGDQVKFILEVERNLTPALLADCRE